MLSSEPLLSLKEAAHLLNVHPSTLRRWADQGDILAVVTPGGHRRFSRQEIERMRSPSAPLVRREPATAAFEQTALRHTREELQHHRHDAWMESMDDAARKEQRELGRRVMGLMMRYIAGADVAVLEEARQIGQTYATMSQSAGLNLSQTLQAMMFFRENIVESILLLPESVRANLDNNKELLRSVNGFLNAVLMGVSEYYDVR